MPIADALLLNRLRYNSLTMIASKICTACGKKLPAADFNDSVRAADGLARTCRACINARRRERYRSGVKHPRGHAQSTIIRSALRQGNVKAVQELLDAGTTPHWDWICETMREGHIGLADMLLQSGVEQNIFTMAAMGDVKRIRNRLRRARADARLTADMEPASSRVTPLHVACASDWKSHGQDRMALQAQAAVTLVEHGADLNALACYRGIGDATPLFCACWSSENLVLVRWLLDHGAVATNECLPAALGHLQRHGRGAHDIAEVLVSYGLAVDDGADTGRTPLQAFAHQGDHRTVAWLIAHGADVNAHSSSGRTAVHYAAERNTGLKTLALLVAAGADLLARDTAGRTPLEIAKLNEKTRLVEWIARRLRANRR